MATAALAYLPEGSPLLDLMSGTGVVTRTLSRYFDVGANDANPYAALLTESQVTDFEGDVEELLSRLRPLAAANEAILRAIASEAISTETSIFHGALDEPKRAQYQTFCAAPVLKTDGYSKRGDDPYHLCLQLYANVYFGVAQCIDLDSLRCAIDQGTASGTSERTLAMAALLTAASTCGTGPHFAQPLKASTLKAFRTIVERRARSIAWEFELALRRLAQRNKLKKRIAVSQFDWRSGLDVFVSRNDRRPSGVYIDPPYSKLQYSRYYHVLNVLLSYDYPAVSGVGRYPPMEQRFSSRFENQPTTARKEFQELFGRCAASGLTTFLSYSDTGFVPIDSLVADMKLEFASIDVLSERIRHHSQGVRTTTKGMVTEYIIVGRP